MEKERIYDLRRDREYYEMKTGWFWWHQNEKKIAQTKPNATEIRGEAESWETIFIASVSDKDLISKIYRELSQICKNISHSPTDQWSKDMNR